MKSMMSIEESQSLWYTLLWEEIPGERKSWEILQSKAKADTLGHSGIKHGQFRDLLQGRDT